MGDVGVTRRRIVAAVMTVAAVALAGALITLWYGLLLVTGALVGAVALALAGSLFVDLDSESGGGRR